MLGWGPASLIVLFVLSLRRLIMRASSRSSRSIGLCIKGRLAEDSKSARPGGWLGSPAAVVAGVLLVIFLRQARARKRLARLGIPMAPNT